MQKPFGMNDLVLKGARFTKDGFEADTIEIDPNNVQQDIDTLKELQRTAGGVQSAVAPMVSEVVKQLCDEKIALKRWTSSAAENVAAYDRLVSYLGDRPISAVTRKDATTLFRTLEGLPSPHGGTLSISMLNKMIGMMSSLFKYANDNNICDHNPFKNLQKTVEVRADQEKDAYTDQEMTTLFASANFTPDKKKPSRYWIPLLMAFSGARPGELAQLTVDDIIVIDGVDCISINENHRIKTVNAIRTIPIVKALKAYGFFRFVDERRAQIDKSKSKDRRLFAELNANRAKPAGAVSSWWNETHHKNCGIENQQKITIGRSTKIRKISLYSIRHKVQTLFRNAGVAETIAAEIVGHEKGNTTYGRYAKSGELQPLIEALNVLKYHTILDFIRSWPR